MFSVAKQGENSPCEYKEQRHLLFALLRTADPDDPDREQIEALREHAKACNPCQKELAILRQVIEILPEAAENLIPDEEVPLVEARLKAKFEARRRVFVEKYSQQA